MLACVALRLLGCDEYSRSDKITFALDTLTLLECSEKLKRKCTEDHAKQVVALRRALMSIPSLKHCKISLHPKAEDITSVYFSVNEAVKRPHYQVGEYVWCQHGGWGFWPGSIHSMDESGLEVLLCWGDMVDVAYPEASLRIHPFMQHLSKYSLMSTNQQEGFHEGVEEILSKIMKRLPKYCVEGFSPKGRERFASRMLRIGKIFEKYMSDLKKNPFFHVLEKEIALRHVKIVKEIEDQERRIIAEERRREKEEREAERAALRLEREKEKALKKEERAQEKMNAKIHSAMTNSAEREQFKKYNRLTVKEMLQNLEKSSQEPTERKRKRSAVKNYRNIKVCDLSGNCINHITTLDKIESTKDVKCIREQDDDTQDEKSLLACIERLNENRNVYPKLKGAQLYGEVYDLLMKGTYTDDESLIFTIKNMLPPMLIKILLYRYFPFEVFRGKHGRTLIHMAAQCDNSAAIPMLNEHWEQRVQSSLVISGMTNLAKAKDSHGRTAVHMACEYGNLKSLKALYHLGCNIYERDKLGYSPLLWCATKDSPKCAFYLIEKGADATEEDKRGRSTLWHSISGGSVLLGKTVLKSGCWMQGKGLQEFVADMSLGREPHRIMFDSRSIQECRGFYLNLVDKVDDSDTLACRRNGHGSTSNLSQSSHHSDSESDDELSTRGRSSSRVVLMSKEVSKETLAVESSEWYLSDYMAEVCLKKPRLIPKFVYSTRSYLGNHSGERSQSSSQAYECCDCEVDCTTNPDCACIMRNGQRSPYSQEGLFDFTKGKIFECGDKCSCKKSCKLRKTQNGVSYPLIVCKTAKKGYGVMTPKVILKGSFVCAYVGEGVSEDDLVEQEEQKVKRLRENGNFVTYAFEIHEGIDTFHVDSEYIGNVARFFNHSCDPNLRPIKVVAASKQKWPTMCFFALRRIEAGEELTWKYVTGVSLKKDGQKCQCKAPNCTGFV